MEFNLNAATFANPVKRLLYGIVFVIIAVLFVILPKKLYVSDRSDCKVVEGKFEKLGIDISKSKNEYFIALKGDSNRYVINPSCEEKEMLDGISNIAPDTKMKLLIGKGGTTLYEIEADGKVWLEFKQAQKIMSKTVRMVTYGGYIAGVVGLFCIVTSIFSFVTRRKI